MNKPRSAKAPAKTILTTWEKSTYDVWGNRQDGYQVNDVYRKGTVELRLKVHIANPRTPQQFEWAAPTDYALRQVFGTSCHLDTDGDDTVIYVNRAKDLYPIGELRLVSHEALSPIREKAEVAK